MLLRACGCEGAGGWTLQGGQRHRMWPTAAACPQAGCKLCVAGAEYRSPQGPMHPLAAAAAGATLVLRANGVAPAAWDARLGLRQTTEPGRGPAAATEAARMALRGLWAVDPRGGPVPHTLVVVQVRDPAPAALLCPAARCPAALLPRCPVRATAAAP